MKRATSFFLLFLQINFINFTQLSSYWTVSHHTKELLHTDIEDMQKNILMLRHIDSGSLGNLTIAYHDNSAGRTKNEWIRTIALFTDNDQELLRKEGDTLLISDPNMALIAATHSTVKVFTWSLPKDPVQAARVRIRRVHLCTLIFDQ